MKLELHFKKHVLISDTLLFNSVPEIFIAEIIISD